MADHAGHPAVDQTVLFRRELRARSRMITRDDPILPREPAIGRPDLLRPYHDGGLSDVNHASARVLSTASGITSMITVYLPN
jgi:hypothetical protein